MNTIDYIKELEKTRQRGQAVIISVVLFMLISLSVMFSIISPLLRETRTVRAFTASKESYFSAEAINEDMLIRLKNNKQTAPVNTLFINNSIATSTISDTGLNKKNILSEGGVKDAIRKVSADITIVAGGGNFNFGVQVGNGGFLMENNSSVIGNIFSNGPVIGSGSSDVSGDIVSAGPTGLIDGMDTGGDGRANTIQNSEIGVDAYYQSISGTTVGGVSYPGSPDIATSSFPLSNDQIEAFKQSATTTIISSPCPYIINSDETIGPAQITCDVEIRGNPTVTLGGFVWIEGDLTITNSPNIKLDSSLGDEGAGFVVDNESDRITSSRVIMRNTTSFEGSGTAGTFVIVISKNDDEKMGGSEVAIELNQSVNGDIILYTNEGEILVKNSGTLSQLTGYLVHLQNASQIEYTTGLASTVFTTGPGGSWSIADWREVE